VTFRSACKGTFQIFENFVEIYEKEETVLREKREERCNGKVFIQQSDFLTDRPESFET
jgi:hypothetical protein